MPKRRKQGGRRGGKRQARSVDVFEADDVSGPRDLIDPEALSGAPDGPSLELPADFVDEEIDEDGAFNAEDYEMYGDVGAGGSGGATSSPAETAGGDDDDGMVQLSDLIDMNKRENAKQEAREERRRRKRAEASGSSTVAAADVKDGDEDVHDQMLFAVMSAAAAKRGEGKRSADNIDTLQLEPETALGMASAESTALTLDDLLSAGAGDATLRGEFRAMTADDNAQTLAAPLSDVKQEEVEREVAFGQAKRRASRWTGVVKQMREADQVVFPLLPESRLNLSTAALATKFSPTTSLEKDFDSLLKSYGAADEASVAQQEAIAMSAGPGADPEQTAAARGKLRKLKSLMFHHELRLKHIKKIKSRKYRKIRKKLKEKNSLSIAELEAIDPEEADRRKRKIEAKRIEERMSLRHKNTSKWVKRQLRISKGNADLRRQTQAAIGEQQNIGNRLRRKMMSADAGRRGSGEADESEDDEQDDSSAPSDVEAALRAGGDQAKAAVARLRDEVSKGIGKSAPRKGLMSMKFMRKAAERRAAAAAALLTEFEAERGDEQDGVDAADSAFGDDNDTSGELALGKGLNEGPKADSKTPLFANGTLMDMATALGRGGARAVAMEGGTVDGAGDGDSVDVKDASDGGGSQDIQVVLVGGSDGEGSDGEGSDGEGRNGGASGKNTRQSTKKSSKNKKSVNESATGGQDDSDDDQNPWLEGGGDHSTAREAIRTGDAARSGAQIDMKKTITAKKKAGSGTRRGFLLGKSDAMARAFALGGDVEEEFRKEKLEAEGVKSKDDDGGQSLPGWGSWGGEGVRVSRAKKRRRAEAAAEAKKMAEAAAERANKAPHLILNQRRNKKAKKYTLASVPHPFASKEQYEMSMRQPLGRDWNTMTSHKEMTKPEVITKVGEIISPMTYKSMDKTAKGPIQDRKKSRGQSRSKRRRVARQKTKA